MLRYTNLLHPAYEREFNQYSAFLASIGVADDRYLVTPQGSSGIAEITINYGPPDEEFGGARAETTVASNGGRTLRFASGLGEALFHLAWYLHSDRAAAIAQALDTNDVQAAMRQLRLDREDVMIDGRGDRSGYIIQTRRDEPRLVLIDTYGEVVPIATSASPATLAYVVRSGKDRQSSDLVERLATFARRA